MSLQERRKDNRIVPRAEWTPLCVHVSSCWQAARPLVSLHSPLLCVFRSSRKPSGRENVRTQGNGRQFAATGRRLSLVTFKFPLPPRRLIYFIMVYLTTLPLDL
jgi:hypothetical protein